MASLTKTERAMRGPGIFQILCGVLLSIVLGVVLAAVYLVLKPVVVVKEPAKEPVLGAVYFVEGTTDGAKAKQWMRKRQLVSEGGKLDVVFSEEELNAWIASVMPQAPVAGAKAAPAPAAAKAGAKDDAKDDTKAAADGPIVVMDRPNFRIRDGVLQLGVPTTVNAFGLSWPLIFQARGHFEKGANGYVFKADELYAGSLPTQLIPGLRDLIVSRLIAAEDVPEDLLAAWGKLSLVAVEGNGVHLSSP